LQSTCAVMIELSTLNYAQTLQKQITQISDGWNTPYLIFQLISWQMSRWAGARKNAEETHHSCPSWWPMGAKPFLATLPTGGRHIRNTTIGYELSGVHCKQVPFSKVLELINTLCSSVCVLFMGKGEASRQEVLFRWTCRLAWECWRLSAVLLGPCLLPRQRNRGTPRFFFTTLWGPEWDHRLQNIYQIYVEFEDIVTHMFCRKFYFQWQNDGGSSPFTSRWHATFCACVFGEVIWDFRGPEAWWVHR
jgi:hypothetical protein